MYYLQENKLKKKTKSCLFSLFGHRKKIKGKKKVKMKSTYFAKDTNFLQIGLNKFFVLTCSNK